MIFITFITSYSEHVQTRSIHYYHLMCYWLQVDSVKNINRLSEEAFLIANSIKTKMKIYIPTLIPQFQLAMKCPV